ncbi:thioredoxin-dependent thiol peroxidase [Microbacterium pseudoresistens]|uniref:thioredoxin-dependent peroxiredoxin n=1 Tax=Microbacterium pseudoresistens TaxID=640634 RepID=A0A7Y9EVH3_9MICO|nr:thioredoxin-dependent thiol peroxidase [Microbacterium pseudoresistens]NYD54722.1 peroxiredoxin Q/BCP [Microbacterium pseudoresistens]
MSETATRLEVGQDAPDFTLNDAQGTPQSLADHRGTPVIVYFYPGAFTPGCTTEACDFRDNLASFQGAGYTVLGISPDPVAKLAEFAEAEQLAFPLLSDEDSAVAKAWGAWGEKTVQGRTFDGLIRSTFVIDATGRIQIAEYAVDAQGHVARLREALGL